MAPAKGSHHVPFVATVGWEPVGEAAAAQVGVDMPDTGLLIG
jgi:hypothetical protein